jgi:hypothetical protein
MNILLISAFFFIAPMWACHFRAEIKSVYSLSGPMTLYFKELGLLSDQKLKGISVFNPISKIDFNKTRVPGGVFISKQLTRSMSGSLIFYDEGAELRKMLASLDEGNAIEIKTRELSPLQVQQQLNEKLSTYVEGCQLEVANKNLNQKLFELKKIISKKQTFLFFLGRITPARLPEVMMVNDGIVKWLREEKLIETYRTELAYVPWSARELKSYNDPWLIGISDSGSSMEKKIEKDGKRINLTYPGSLVPGRGQVEAMLYLMENISL